MLLAGCAHSPSQEQASIAKSDRTVGELLDMLARYKSGYTLHQQIPTRFLETPGHRNQSQVTVDAEPFVTRDGVRIYDIRAILSIGGWLREVTVWIDSRECISTKDYAKKLGAMPHPGSDHPIPGAPPAYMWEDQHAEIWLTSESRQRDCLVRVIARNHTEREREGFLRGQKYMLEQREKLKNQP